LNGGGERSAESGGLGSQTGGGERSTDSGKLGSWANGSENEGEDADGDGDGAMEMCAHCGGGGRRDRCSEREEKGAGSRRGGGLWRGRAERRTMAATCSVAWPWRRVGSSHGRGEAERGVGMDKVVVGGDDIWG
jgi:hypothetical protein